MKTPYAALLALRRLEEKQAEMALAQVQRELADTEQDLALAHDGREAWIDQHLDRPLDAPSAHGLAALVTRIERVERAARGRLETAMERAEAARLGLIERRRTREAVERLHDEALARLEQAAARRAQAELDDLASLAAQSRAAQA